MIHALAIWLLRLYPRTWRMRYEEEVRALLEDRPPQPADLLGLARGAASERIVSFVDPVEHPWLSAAVWATTGWFGTVLVIQLVGVFVGGQLATVFGPGPWWLGQVPGLLLSALLLRTMYAGTDWVSIPMLRSRPLSAREIKAWWLVLVIAVVFGHWTHDKTLSLWDVWMFAPFAIQSSTAAAWLRARARADWMKARERHRDAVAGYSSVAQMVSQGLATRRELDDLGRDVARFGTEADRAAAAYRATGTSRLPPSRPLGL